MKLNKYTKGLLSITLTILLSYGLVSAWINLGTVTSGATLTETIWNNMIAQVNETGNRVSGIFTDGSGNVGVGTETPSAKLDVSGDFIRTIAHATGNGPNETIDVGQLVSRVLTFTKTKDSTKIRIAYVDNFRTSVAAKSCRWEIKVNGASCPNQPLIYDLYTDGSNLLRLGSVFGYCSGLTAGTYEIQVWVGGTPGYTGGDCYTGWPNSTWVIEAEEVN